VAGSPYSIAHNLNSPYPQVQAWDTVTGDLIIVRMHILDANHIQVFFEQNAPNNVAVVVTGSGPGGAQTISYHWAQATASTTWTITHNLSFQPNVTAVDSAGTQIYPGALKYLNATTIELDFSAAVGGDAYLS
jgi:hypothetical protein